MLYSNIFFLFFIVSEYRLYLIQRTSFQHEIHHFLGRLPVISQSVVCEINISSLIKPLRACQSDSVKVRCAPSRWTAGTVCIESRKAGKVSELAFPAFHASMRTACS